MGRILNTEETKEILSIKTDDIDKKLLINLFAYKENKAPKYDPTDKIKLPANSIFKNKEIISTTVGRYIFNIFLVAPNLIDAIGYQNGVMDKKGLGKFEDKLSKALLDEKITVEDYFTYLNKVNWLGFSINDFICPGMGVNFVIPNEKVIKRKNELLKEHEEELANGDTVVAAQIEKELVTLAKEELKDDPGMDLFISGAGQNMDNNYKNLCIMKGPIKDNSTGEYHITTSNYMDGVKKEEFPYFADALVYSSYSRAVSTQKGGYICLMFTLKPFNCWKLF